MIDERTQKLIRCVYLSYGMNRTNTEIAEIINEPRTKIPALLREAEELGIVRREYDFPEDVELEHKLLEAFELRDARVVSTGEMYEGGESQKFEDTSQKEKEALDSFEYFLRKQVGKTAADYFERTTPDEALKVGFSGGRTLHQVATHLHDNRFKNLTIFPLAVSMDPGAVANHTNTIAGIVGGKYPECKSYSLSLPPLIMTNGGATTEEIQRQKELILKNAYLRNVFFEIKEIDVALIGISNLSEGRGISWMFNHLADAGIVEQGLLNRLITEHGFVGEILYQPFRPDGEIPPEAKKLISPVLERAFLSITLDELKKKVEAGKRILLIGSGDNKVRAIVGALRAKYANILITDERTAKRLLDEAQRGITG
jgi:deoxyribonucleoside regulator